MKEKLSPLEQQMRSWQPRHVSGLRRHRIFSWRPESARSVKWVWSYLTPSLACLLLTVMTIQRAEDGWGQKTARTVCLTQPSLVAPASEHDLTAQNRWDAVTFDWTNRSAIKTISRFTPSTNFIN